MRKLLTIVLTILSMYWVAFQRRDVLASSFLSFLTRSPAYDLKCLDYVRHGGVCVKAQWKKNKVYNAPHSGIPNDIYCDHFVI